MVLFLKFKINNNMKILFSFLISILLFIYGISIFSDGLKNIYQTPILGIVFGTITTAIFQSSSIMTITILSLVNSGIITFHNSLGLIMGANLGTCITSFIIAYINNLGNNIEFFLNPSSYIPLILLIGIFFYFKKHKNKSNIFIGFSLFMLGLFMLNTSLSPIKDFAWFKDFLISLNSPLLGIIAGIIATCIIQSSSATIAILQTLSINNNITYLMAIPIIMGENIGSCITALIASIGTSKNAKKVAIAHLLYNILGTIIFLILFYISKLFSFNLLENNVNSISIALIHTSFNLLSIFIFLPFIKKFESLINKLVK